MFKYIALVLLFAAAVSAGLIETHHLVHQPVYAKVGTVVHSAPSAVSHQSITQVHSKAVVEPVLAPVLKTTVHAAPVVAVASPIVKTIHAAPIVHAASLVHTVPVVHSVPVVHAAPLAYTLHH